MLAEFVFIRANSWLGWSIFSLFFPLFCIVPQSAAFIRGWILNQPVSRSPFMIGWQILGNRKSLLVHEEQAVAIFVDLHVIAGADPGAVLDFFFLAGIEPAGTKRLAQGVDVVGQPQYHG